MKKSMGLLVLLVLVATLVLAGAKRIETVSGDVSISLSGKDSTGYLALFTPMQIGEMSGGADRFENRTWDHITGSVILANLSDAGDSVDNENAVDSLIVRYKFKTKWYTITAEEDTVTLPGTTYFCISADEWASGQQFIAPNDSASAYWYPNLTSDFSAFLMDQFAPDYYVTDTAGASGDLTGTMQYWFKFYEDD